MRFHPASAAALCLTLLVCLNARAQAPSHALPFQESARLGRASFPLRVENANGNVEVSVGTARHTLEGVEATALTYTTEPLPGDIVIGLLRVETGRGAHLIVLGSRGATPVVIWSDSISLRGDPGERRGYSLITRSPEGASREIGIAEVHEGVSTCNGHQVSVRTRWLNPRTLTLDPPTGLMEAAPATEAGTEMRIVMDTSIPEAFATPPRHFPLRSRWSTLGVDAGPISPLPTAATVLDRDLSTGMTTEKNRAAVVTFGVSSGGSQVRALTFTVASGGHPASAALVVQGDAGDPIPAEITVRAAEPTRFWLTLPTPQTWRCLEVTLVGKPNAGPLTIFEVEAFTDVDTQDGLSGLVSRVITEERGGTDAARLLVSFGDDGIRALEDAWERLGPQGKRRAVLAVAPRAAQSTAARRILVRAVSDADSDLRDRALVPLVKAGKHAFPELAELARAATPIGSAAVSAIGESGHPDAVPTLLALLSAPGGADRADVRDALSLAVAAEGGGELVAVQAWLGTQPTAQAQAAALPSLAHPSTRNEALGAWRALTAQPLEFTELWRLIAATGGLGAAPEVDTWLERLAREDDRWMIREAALSSLWTRDAPGAEAAALARLEDEYPRVRARAVGLLASGVAHRPVLEQRFDQDAWPMVRARILDEIPAGHGDNPLPIRALKDDAPLVRTAAIRALTRAKRARAWPEVATLLRSTAEWPAVMSAALEFADHACIDTAVPDLRKVIRRGLKPNAWAPDVDLAMEAIDVLGRIGTPSARAILEEIQRTDPLLPIRQAATRALNSPACNRSASGA